MRPNSPARSYDTALRLRMQSCKEFRRQSLPLGRQRACCASTCLRCHCQKSRSEPLLLSRRDVLELKFLLAAGAVELHKPREASAIKAVKTLDGKGVEAFEFDVGLRIVTLSGSVPAEWEQEFRAAASGKAKLSLDRRTQLLDIFNELSQPQKKKSAATADAVTLSDVLLGPAISQGLVQPLSNAEDQAWWDLLSPRWQRLVRRDTAGRLCSNGDVWAVPYRWGCMLIAYRTDRLNARRGAKPIEDWQDLLQPALKGRLGISEGPREFMAAVFKSLDLPLNATTEDLASFHVSRAALHAQVAAFRAQVRQISTRELQQALAAGDTWAAIGASSDLVPLALRHNNIALVAPASGTALWSDLWAVPRAAKGGHRQRGPSPLLPAWILYGLEPARANRRRGLQGGASPRLLPATTSEGARHSQPAAAPLQGSKLGEAGSLDLSLGDLMPSDEILERSEFLEPLDTEMRDLFWSLLVPSK